MAVLQRSAFREAVSPALLQERRLSHLLRPQAQHRVGLPGRSSKSFLSLGRQLRDSSTASKEDGGSRQIGQGVLHALAGFASSTVIDQDFLDELNKVSNCCLEVLSSGQEEKAKQLSEELQEMRMYLEEEQDEESSRFLRVLQGLLNHTVLKEAESLEGMYSRAVDRIFNQIAGSPWKLVEEGKSAEAGFATEEPHFSTWDDVLNGKKQEDVATSSGTPDTEYYRLLGVEPTADAASLKAAYRQLALKVHPDVNQANDATERFAEISIAYDVLSDPVSRDLYDRFGTDMASKQGASAGRGNAREAWDEFKPHKRENKRTKARDAVRTQAGAAATASELKQDAEREEGLPQLGDIVEYPLRNIEREDFADGRSHGVGLLVGRNMDRGDASKLPVEQLAVCEVEPLRQEEPDSHRWIADELGVSSFARLEEMRVLPVAAFDSRYDVWTIDTTLSEGCGGPPLPQEIIL